MSGIDVAILVWEVDVVIDEPRDQIHIFIKMFVPLGRTDFPSFKIRTICQIGDRGVAMEGRNGVASAGRSGTRTGGNVGTSSDGRS